MLKKIEEVIYGKYNKDDVLWVFLSSFDKNNNMLTSQGALEPSKPLAVLLPLLYKSLEGDSDFVAIDIVHDIIEHKDKDSFLSLDMAKHGLFLLSWDKSGVILPDTAGIDSSKTALAAIKKKYAIDGKVRLFSFTTDRIVVS